MNLKIIVCCHKEVPKLDESVFMPIHVGKKNAKVDLGIPGDDTGDNISEMNYLYCELTGLYWAWKNLEADYLGLCHYRRLFSFHTKNKIQLFVRKVYYKIQQVLLAFSYTRKDTSFFYARYNVSGKDEVMKESRLFNDDINNYLARKPETVAFALREVNYGIISNYDRFSGIAGSYHLEITKKIIEQKYPTLNPYFSKTLYSNKLHYANMVIMKKEVFDNYCSFVFDVLKSHLNCLITDGYVISAKEKSLSRLSGYLGELLTSTYISYLLAKNEQNVKLLSQIQIKG